MIKFDNGESYVEFDDIDEDGDVTIEVWDNYHGTGFYWPLDKEDCQKLIDFLTEQLKK